MRTAIILATLTVASPALADGALVKSCDFSSAGSCPFHGVKGTDYLIRARLGQNCGTDNHSKIELVNPAGQVTLAMFLGGACTGNYGREFRAAFTGTYHLRYVPDEGMPFNAGGAVFTDCPIGSKTRCTVPPGGRKVAGEHSANGDIDWYGLPDLRPGRFYTITAQVDAPTSLWVGNADGDVLVAGHADRGTGGTVRFQANGTYFLFIPDGHHYTLSMK